MIRNLKRNCSNSAKHYFSNWFLFLHAKQLWLLFISWILLQLVMQNFLRQCLMITSTWLVAKNSLLLLLIVYWESSQCRFARRWSIRSIVVFFIVNFYRVNIVLIKQYEFFAIYQIQHCLSQLQFWLSSKRRRCNDLDWLFVSFIEYEFSIVFLISKCIEFI